MTRYVCEECREQWARDEASILLVERHEQTTGHHVFILNLPGAPPDVPRLCD
jgi:hypothetical protein